MKRILSCLCLITLSSILLSACFTLKSSKTDASMETQWALKPSFKYDTLCFINALVGDAYYLKYYRKDYEKFSTLFTPDVSSALNEMKIQKENYHVILGAWLCNIYSVTDDESLDDMIATLDNDGEIWSKYPGSEEEKIAFEAYGKNNLKTIFKFLKENDFENYWKENILPKIQSRISELQELGISQYDIIPEIEKYVGSELGSDTITVHLLYFAQPHGIRIQGANFITDISYPFDTVMGNAIHEMFHPPFGKNNTEFNHARDSLKNDPYILEKMASQDQYHGYPTYESYFEENCVDALEAIVREKVGTLDEGAKTYFRNHDGGIDALGIALYLLIKEEDYTAKGESFESFFIRMVNTGKLVPGKIKELNDQFFSIK